MDFTEVLPCELSLRILSFVSANDLCRAAHASRTFAALTNDDALWKDLCRVEWADKQFRPVRLHPLIPLDGLTEEESAGIRAERDLLRLDAPDEDPGPPPPPVPNLGGEFFSDSDSDGEVEAPPSRLVRAPDRRHRRGTMESQDEIVIPGRLEPQDEIVVCVLVLVPILPIRRVSDSALQMEKKLFRRAGRLRQGGHQPDRDGAYGLEF
ncbi:hypothetical protein HK101_011907 [Irineochytrium annulatum]|nr:hypothetical protein HK101_011907 [Irineochytrium annulatum]